MAGEIQQAGMGATWLRSVLGVISRGQTYKNLLYLLLAFPLGMLYFMLLLFGFVFGTVLAFFLVGIAILLATILGGRILGEFERWLANALLAVSITPPDDLNRHPEDSTITQIRRYIDAPSTWRALGFLLLKFWAGILGFILVFSVISALLLVTSPLHYPHFVEFLTVNDEPIGWHITTFEESLLAVPLGLGVTIVLLHVSNAVSYVLGQSAQSLLGGNEPPADRNHTPTQRQSGPDAHTGMRHEQPHPPAQQSPNRPRDPQHDPTQSPQQQSGEPNHSGENEPDQPENHERFDR